jgi:hypothetical protein
MKFVENVRMRGSNNVPSTKLFCVYVASLASKVMSISRDIIEFYLKLLGEDGLSLMSQLIKKRVRNWRFVRGFHQSCNDSLNLLKTKRNLLYIRNQSVPRSCELPWGAEYENVIRSVRLFVRNVTALHTQYIDGATVREGTWGLILVFVKKN